MSGRPAHFRGLLETKKTIFLLLFQTAVWYNKNNTAADGCGTRQSAVHIHPEGGRYMQTKQFRKGEVIFREGSDGRTMYEIKSGSVGIYIGYGTADEKKLTELEAGRLFGEMAVIEAAPRSATAVALEDSEATEISGDDFGTYFGAQSEKLMEIMRGMSRRLRELTADYQEVCGTIGEWKESARQGKKKRAGLMETIKRFAAIFAESAKYMPMPNDGLYFHSYYLY